MGNVKKSGRHIWSILFNKIFPLIILTSCTIAINENGHRFLTDQEKQFFRPFSMDAFKNPHSYKNSMVIYEISSRDIKQITRKYRFTWVHIWAPYCRGKNCNNVINLISEVFGREKSNDMMVLLVSNSYDLRDIKLSLKNADYTLPVFVISNSAYGYGQSKGQKQMALEMDNNTLLRHNEYFSDYFFRDTLLIKASWNVTLSQIDSLMGKQKF